MDPNENLTEQLQIAAGILAAEEKHTHGAVRLAELIQALDGWIRREGFLPSRWQKGGY